MFTRGSEPITYGSFLLSEAGKLGATSPVAELHYVKPVVTFLKPTVPYVASGLAALQTAHVVAMPSNQRQIEDYMDLGALFGAAWMTNGAVSRSENIGSISEMEAAVRGESRWILQLGMNGGSKNIMSVPRATGPNIVGVSGSEMYGTIPQTGEFSIIDWSRYPAGLPQPAGLFRLLSGAEYAQARAAANVTNAAIRQELPLWSNAGLEWHEIQPVKFGGSPTDLANKIPLPSSFHRSQVTPWWNAFQRGMGGN